MSDRPPAGELAPWEVPRRWSGRAGADSTARRRREFGLGAGPPRRRRGRHGTAWRVTRVVTALLSVLCGVVGVLTAYAALTLPSVAGIGQATGTIRLLDRHGTLIAEVGTAQGSPHTDVQLAQVSAPMQQAIVAVEDRNFWNEGAINAGRILKALFVDVLAGRPQQGASTITQQLAKRAFLLDDSSSLRKLREALLANEVDQRFDKRSILEMYLNIVYFGHGATGIEDAATTYFGKHAAGLNLAEASLIAGLPQAPSLYDPFENADGAFARQHDVLQAMVATGDISPAQAESVDPRLGGAAPTVAQEQIALSNQATVLLDLQNGHAPARPPVLAPHFVEYARNQLAAVLADQSSVYRGSLTVTTSLDLPTQRSAELAVARGVTSLGPRLVNNGALLMLDAHHGDVLSMVGSADFNGAAIGGQFNVVTALRRPGSAFKPIVYAAAFDSGALTPDSRLHDTYAESQHLGGVTDFDSRFQGIITAADSLLRSRNVPTEEAMLHTGLSQTIDFAHRLGITSPLADNASTAIGSSSVRMIDLAAAYTALSQVGTMAQPRAILRVSDASGALIYDASSTPGTAAVMSATAAEQVNGILRGYPQYWHLGFKHPTAGKSGTTDRFIDAWYMSYTPDWVVATWAGHTEGSNPAEVPLKTVYGVDVGRAITVPFVNSLPGPYSTLTASR